MSLSIDSSTSERADASAKFAQLAEALGNVGLETEVRNGRNCSLLVFVKPASKKVLTKHVYRSRVKDWLYGVRAAQPDEETHDALIKEPLTQAERYRIIHHMITSPTDEGGAGYHAQARSMERGRVGFPSS